MRSLDQGDRCIALDYLSSEFDRMAAEVAGFPRQDFFLSEQVSSRAVALMQALRPDMANAGKFHHLVAVATYCDQLLREKGV